MQRQRLAITLTVVNLMLMAFTMMQVRSTTAQATAPILRGRTLEVVDERGVVRARLGVKGQDGPIELDLFDKSGRVRAKFGAGEDGSGLLLTDEVTGSTLPSYVQLIARRTATSQKPKTTSITLRGAQGRERVITAP